MAQDKEIVNMPIVLIGGSAGSLSVLLEILPLLPSSLAAPVVLVTHRHAGSDVLLEALLSARASLPVRDIEEKEKPQPGVIYIVPADYHLLFESDGSFALDSSEKVNYSRPSIDVTFESVARTFGAAAIGILLSGANADGAQGLYEIQLHNGITIVQDPDTAEVDYMPRAVLQRFIPDHVVTPSAMPGLICSLIDSYIAST